VGPPSSVELYHVLTFVCFFIDNRLTTRKKYTTRWYACMRSVHELKRIRLYIVQSDLPTFCTLYLGHIEHEPYRETHAPYAGDIWSSETAPQDTMIATGGHSGRISVGIVRCVPRIELSPHY
jgi:hypothetical protein